MEKHLIKKYFRHVPTFETENLILRKIKVSDYTDMFEYSSLDSVTEYLTWNSHRNEEYTKRYLKLVQDQYYDGEFYDWAVVLKNENKMIGTCGFTSFDIENNAGEVGYVINPNYAKKRLRNGSLAKNNVRGVYDFKPPPYLRPLYGRKRRKSACYGKMRYDVRGLCKVEYVHKRKIQVHTHLRYNKQ